MNRLKTRILSVVIATALIFSMIPATVFGASYNPEDGNIEAFFNEIAAMFAQGEIHGFAQGEIRGASNVNAAQFIAFVEAETGFKISDFPAHALGVDMEIPLPPGVEVVELEGVFTVKFPTPNVLKGAEADELKFFVIGMNYETMELFLMETDVELLDVNGSITIKLSDVELPLVVLTIATFEPAPTGVGSVTIAAIAMFAFIATSAGLWSYLGASKRKNSRVSA
ncbi:MAG: hypothetical protein FWD19_04055 [Defluviitaleaceae bacterium]|nr:hypothetical protein [Defluviitaleaceae bacterium]